MIGFILQIVMFKPGQNQHVCSNQQFTGSSGFGARRALSRLRGTRRWMLASNNALHTTFVLFDDAIPKVELPPLARVGGDTWVELSCNAV